MFKFSSLFSWGTIKNPSATHQRREPYLSILISVPQCDVVAYGQEYFLALSWLMENFWIFLIAHSPCTVCGKIFRHSMTVVSQS